MPSSTQWSGSIGSGEGQVAWAAVDFVHNSSSADLAAGTDRTVRAALSCSPSTEPATDSPLRRPITRRKLTIVL
jgi:hypothetical protein